MSLKINLNAKSSAIAFPGELKTATHVKWVEHLSSVSSPVKSGLL